MDASPQHYMNRESALGIAEVYEYTQTALASVYTLLLVVAAIPVVKVFGSFEEVSEADLEFSEVFNRDWPMDELGFTASLQARRHSEQERLQRVVAIMRNRVRMTGAVHLGYLPQM